MPMTCPSRSSNGPPELPGLTAASIWIKPRNTIAVLLELEGAAEPGDDALAHRGGKTERAADRVGLAPLADTVRVAQGRRHDLGRWARRAKHRDVVGRVAGHDLGRGSRAVGERHRDVRGVADDMQAGQDVAREVDHDPAADALVGACPAVRSRPLDLDEHDRWSDCGVHRLREGRRRRHRRQGLTDLRVDVVPRQRRWPGEQRRCRRPRPRRRRRRRRRTGPTDRVGGSVAARLPMGALSSRPPVRPDRSLARGHRWPGSRPLLVGRSGSVAQRPAGTGTPTSSALTCHRRAVVARS